MVECFATFGGVPPFTSEGTAAEVSRMSTAVRPVTATAPTLPSNDSNSLRLPRCQSFPPKKSSLSWLIANSPIQGVATPKLFRWTEQLFLKSAFVDRRARFLPNRRSVRLWDPWIQASEILLPRHQGLIGSKEIGRMRALIHVNTARGRILDSGPSSRRCTRTSLRGGR